MTQMKIGKGKKSWKRIVAICLSVAMLLSCIDIFPETAAASSGSTEESKNYIWTGNASGDCVEVNENGQTGSAPKTTGSDFVTSAGYSCGLEVINPYNETFQLYEQSYPDQYFATLIQEMESPTIVVTTQNGGDAYAYDWSDAILLSSGVAMDITAVKDAYIASRGTTYLAFFCSSDIITKVELYDAATEPKATPTNEPTTEPKATPTDEPTVAGTCNYSAIPQDRGTDDDFRIGITYVSEDWKEYSMVDFTSTKLKQITGKGDYTISYTTAATKKLGMLWLDTNLYLGSKLQVDVTRISISDPGQNCEKTFSMEDNTLQKPGSLWGFRDCNKEFNYAAMIVNPYMWYGLWNNKENFKQQYKEEYAEYVQGYESFDQTACIDLLNYREAISEGSCITIHFTVKENPDIASGIIPTNTPNTITGVTPENTPMVSPDHFQTSVPAATPYTGTIDGFQYLKNNSGGITITGYEDSTATSLVVPDEIEGLPVTTIGNAAFHKMYWLERVILPDTLKTIEGCAFQKCNHLEECDIPDTVTAIGNYAFFDCNIEVFSLPKSLEQLGYGICIGSKEVTIDASNEHFQSDNGILYNKDGTTVVWVPSQKKTVNLLPTVNELGNWAFSNSKLTSFEVPEGVIKIGLFCFYGAEIVSLWFPSTLTEIGMSYTFGNQMKSFAVSKDNQAFTAIDGVLYSKDKKRLVAVPATRNQYEIPSSVVEIGSFAFYGSDITVLDVPATVQSVGDNAFFECAFLKCSFTGGTTLAGGCFSNCSNLRVIQLGENTVIHGTTAGEEIYMYCPNLQYLIAPEGVKLDTSKVVLNGLENLVIYTTKNSEMDIYAQQKGYTVSYSACTTTQEDGVYYIMADGEATLYYAVARDYLEVPDKVQGIPVSKIGKSSLCNCMAVILPDTVKTIGKGALTGGKVYIPESVTSIEDNNYPGIVYTVAGSYAEQWAKNQGITVIDEKLIYPDNTPAPGNTNTPDNTIIPENTITPGNGYHQNAAAANVPSPVVRPSAVPTAPAKLDVGTETAPDDTRAVSKVIIGDGATVILAKGKDVSSVSIDTVEIGGQSYKVTEIKANAYKNKKKLKKITIGKSVKKVGINAFSGCKNLKNITFQSKTVPNLGKNAFKNIHKKAKFYVPKKALKQYKKKLKAAVGYRKTMKIVGR